MLSAFQRIVRAARRIAAAAPLDPVEAVHEYRKSIRRARSVVALLRPALGRAAARGTVEHLRSAFRETSALRDDHVLLATLNGLAGDDPALLAEAAALGSRMADAGERNDVDVLRSSAAHLRPLPAALEVVLPPDFSTSALEKGLARSYRRTRQALDRAVETRNETDFHEWRKREKELRYQVELLASGGSKPLKRREKSLGELARELGEVTDLMLLRRALEPFVRPGEAGGGDALLQRARSVARERAEQLLARGSELFADTPRSFALQVLAERG